MTSQSEVAETLPDISQKGENAIDQMEQLYRADDRPWVVAYSGGKDSSLVLQLVVNLLLKLGSEATKDVHVVASDTRVEAPIIEEYLEDRLSHLRGF
ncbi:MAG: DNA phosphorothioation system sulfurtransferase DndC, partial [Thiohalorhabdaceae bacterium]